MAETERFEKQSFDFLHLFLCYSVLFSSLSHFLSTYSTYSFGCFYRGCCQPERFPARAFGFYTGLNTPPSRRPITHALDPLTSTIYSASHSYSPIFAQTRYSFSAYGST